MSLLDDATLVVLALSLVPITAVALLGGAVALLQAATQVQEASLVHLFRLIAIGIVLAVCGETGYRMVEVLFTRSLELLGAI